MRLAGARAAQRRRHVHVHDARRTVTVAATESMMTAPAMAAPATIGGGAVSVSGGADSCGDSDRSVDRHLRCLHSRTTRTLSEVVAMYRMLSADANGIPLQAPWSGGS